MPLSKKGFIAIDIDGTMLVEKMDHNIVYGLLDKDSHIRQTIAWLIELATSQGYDLYILTARPKLAEQLLSVPGKFLPEALRPETYVGTKLSNEIITLLGIDQVKIKEVKHDSNGLKGDTMQAMLAEYGEDAQGILFEDQLRQINDVMILQDPRLMAFDINHPSHLLTYQLNFCENIQQEMLAKDPFSMVGEILKGTVSDGEFDIAPIIKNLQKLQEQELSGFAQERLEAIIDDLALRLYEAHTVGYRPEIVWAGAISEALVVLLASSNIELENIYKLKKVTFDKPARTSVAKLISRFSRISHINQKHGLRGYEQELQQNKTHDELYEPNTTLQLKIAGLLDTAVALYNLKEPAQRSRLMPT